MAQEGREECGQVYWVTRSMREPRERRYLLREHKRATAKALSFSLSIFSNLFSLSSPLYLFTLAVIRHSMMQQNALYI